MLAFSIISTRLRAKRMLCAQYLREERKSLLAAKIRRCVEYASASITCVNNVIFGANASLRKYHNIIHVVKRNL